MRSPLAAFLPRIVPGSDWDALHCTHTEARGVRAARACASGSAALPASNGIPHAIGGAPAALLQDIRVLNPIQMITVESDAHVAIVWHVQ